MKVIKECEISENCCFKSKIRVVIPREERGIEEFNGEEFLTRKSGEENKELTGLNKDLFRGKTRKLRKKVEEKFNLKNFNA